MYGTLAGQRTRSPPEVRNTPRRRKKDDISIKRTARKYHASIVAGALVIAVLAASFAFALAQNAADGSLRAYVHDGDGNVRELDLSQECELSVSTSLGSNTIVVEDGSVRIVQADCPNHDCMRQQPISQPGQQLICLPHKLWVEVRAEGDTEGTLDIDAVQAVDAENDDAVDLVAR